MNQERSSEREGDGLVTDLICSGYAVLVYFINYSINKQSVPECCGSLSEH